MKHVSKNKFLVFVSTLLFTILVLGSFYKKGDEVEVVMNTSKGELILKLYNETPIHRDNFIKLVNNQFYNGISFHRVIKNFMAQAGDPNSRDPKYSGSLGNNSEGETLTAEIHPSLFHKKGALAAARMGDQVNPEKRSSGSQFYLVQGKKYNRNQLAQMEARINQQQEGNLVGAFLKDTSNSEFMNRVKVCQQNAWMDSLNIVIDEIKTMVLNDVDKFTFSEEHLKAYETVGGTPFLDNGYTVFGEVVSGIDIIDSICISPTLPGDKPKDPIIILSVKINS
ncbi:MAG: peptidylprolyl isomerase [Bacteroidota bacterium]|nr:peptidylprolyl isomerase [Bacteroidota bacterium]